MKIISTFSGAGGIDIGMDWTVGLYSKNIDVSVITKEYGDGYAGPQVLFAMNCHLRKANV